MLEMTARTTKDPLDDSKAWVYNNPVVEGGEQITSAVGAANQILRSPAHRAHRLDELSDRRVGLGRPAPVMAVGISAPAGVPTKA